MQGQAYAMRVKKQRQPNEMNKEYQEGNDEISAQKLCAGMMSIGRTGHAGREGFSYAPFGIRQRGKVCDATIAI